MPNSVWSECVQGDAPPCGRKLRLACGWWYQSRACSDCGGSGYIADGVGSAEFCGCNGQQSGDWECHSPSPSVRQPWLEAMRED